MLQGDQKLEAERGANSSKAGREPDHKAELGGSQTTRALEWLAGGWQGTLWRSVLVDFLINRRGTSWRRRWGHEGLLLRMRRSEQRKGGPRCEQIR